VPTPKHTQYATSTQLIASSPFPSDVRGSAGE
jgi:hypothetical protein